VIKYPRNASHRDRAETRLLGLISLLGGGGLIFSPRNVEGVGRFNRGRNGAIIKKKRRSRFSSGLFLVVASLCKLNPECNNRTVATMGR
jgi:hypothetical protein